MWALCHGAGMTTNSALTARLEAKARALGLSLFGVASAEPSAHMPYYADWLARERHGGMGYLSDEESVARRADLRGTMDTVASVVVVGHEYYHEDDPARARDPARGVVARYARGEDYHHVLKDKLLTLQAWLQDEVRSGTAGDSLEARAYVDTGPILERDLARRAGLGWFGKNTVLIDPRRGSWFLLGLLLVDLELPATGPFEEEHCGSCNACIDACPTDALLGHDADGAPVIDARRCISYLTIELRDVIPLELRPLMGNRVFGCDICQEVCPWNAKFAAPTSEPAYAARAELDGPRLVDFAYSLLDMSEKAYQRAYADSPLARPRRKGMLRNLCVALGNWAATDAVAAADALAPLSQALNDGQPLVRAHAAWALGQFSDGAGVTALESRREVEEIVWVAREISGSLGM